MAFSLLGSDRLASEVTGLYRVPTTQIRPGMRLGKSVITANGQVLLQAGVSLKEAFIAPLLSYGVAAVYVVNELAPDVVPTDVVSDESRNLLAGEMNKTLAEMRSTFGDAAKSGLRHFSPTLQIESLQRTVNQVVTDLLSNPKVAVSLQDIRTADEYTLGHSVNVCILSTLLGAELGYSTKELRELAMGALLHDIGKIAIPSEILHKPGRLTPEETEVMNQHPTIGWQLLQNQMNLSYTSSIVALQHHERWSGGGYPCNLKGNQIYKFARVCAVADCYDAMTADRIYRKGMSPVQALETLAGPMHGHFDPQILLVFMQCIAPWPVGSMVELTCGRKAVVTEVTRGRSDRPQVRVVLDADGSRLLEPYEIDLFTDRSTEIIGELHEDADLYLQGAAG